MPFGNQFSILFEEVGGIIGRSAARGPQSDSRRIPNKLDYGLDSRKFKAYRFINKLDKPSKRYLQIKNYKK